MKKYIHVLIFTVLFSVTGFAQTPVPTPPPLVLDDVVKISTTLIQVDATVTDKKGNAVRDLTEEDFEIYENGKKQNITGVTFVAAGETQPVVKNSDKAGKNPLPPTPNEIKPKQIRRTMALVVDDLTLSFESTYFVKRALKKFVDEQMQNGDLVAIIRTGGGIGALQQFTSDKRVLYAAIEKIRWQSYGAGGISAFGPIEATPLEKAKANGAEISEEMIKSERDFIKANKDFREDVFTTGTLGAINYIIRGMKELPGRKSIMLMSDGLQILSQNKDGFNDSTRVLDLLNELVDTANRAEVVVYTMDARGLQSLGATAADDFSALSSQKIAQRLTERRDELFDTQEGLVYLAKQTGGFPIINQNDLNGGIRKVLDDQSYYLIAYEPDEETFDVNKRRFNALEVKVKRDNVNVRYRSGFFGIEDDKIEKPKNLTPYQQISTALTSPFAVNDIKLNLNTVFGSDAKFNYFINSFLYISINDLKFTDEPNKMKKAVFDVLAMSFGDNGTVVESLSKTYTINLKPESYQKLLNEGFVYNFTFPIKKAGAYQMRVAIRDHATEKVGSASQFVEVPQLDKKRLTLSGMIVENLSRELYDKGENASSANPKLKSPDALADTALRSFKRGTVLRYGFEIYNAKSTNLQIKTRVFREGKLIFEGKPKPVETSGQTDAKVKKTGGAINIGEEMETGDYILQVVVTDDSAKEKFNNASQFVQFEVIN